MTTRLSDLLGRVVYDASGGEIGRIHDVTAERVGQWGDRDALRVTGIVCGRGSVGARLGYATTQEQGPLLLRLVFGSLARRAKYIRWEALRFDDERIVVTTPVDSLPHPTEALR